MAIQNRWSLVEFKNIHGKCRVGKFTRSNGEQFDALTFGESPNWIMVLFGTKVGVLTAAELVARKDELQVVERDNMLDPTKVVYVLCEKGNMPDLEEVDL